MTIFKKRIEGDDLEEIKERKQMIRQHLLIAQALKSEMKYFLNSKLSKYKLDGSKVWDFDVKTGNIVEVKSNKVT